MTPITAALLHNIDAVRAALQRPGIAGTAMLISGNRLAWHLAVFATADKFNYYFNTFIFQHGDAAAALCPALLCIVRFDSCICVVADHVEHVMAVQIGAVTTSHLFLSPVCRGLAASADTCDGIPINNVAYNGLAALLAAALKAAGTDGTVAAQLETPELSVAAAKLLQHATTATQQQAGDFGCIYNSAHSAGALLCAHPKLWATAEGASAALAAVRFLLSLLPGVGQQPSLDEATEGSHELRCLATRIIWIAAAAAVHTAGQVLPAADLLSVISSALQAASTVALLQQAAPMPQRRSASACWPSLRCWRLHQDSTEQRFGHLIGQAILPQLCSAALSC